MDLIKLHEAIKLYEIEGMEKGKQTETCGIKERTEFLAKYPIEFIPNLTIEQYALGEDSFSYWICHKLRHFASMGNTRPGAFGVYTVREKGSKILLSKSCEKNFGSDYKKAFYCLREAIVKFLEDIRQENYDNYETYKGIDRNVRDMLLAVYFYDRFVPVCTENMINDCLNRVDIPFEKKTSRVYKNLALVEWKKTVPELADWSNQMLLNFCNWLIRKDKIINKEEPCNNALIEKAQKIEAEITPLNIDGVSKKAVVDVRVNQGIFRDLLLERYNKCCLCKVENPNLLIASHIKPWAESEPKEKLDVNNGFLMCPNHDKLFDKGYITFDNDGKIIISDELKDNDRVFLNINSRMHLNVELTEGNKKYMKFHREKVFIDK